jgi:hypothetical protein
MHVLNYQYRLGNSFILQMHGIKDLSVHIVCKLHFHCHVGFRFSHALKLLGIIRTITFLFSILDSLLMVYFALIRSELEYASVAWNFVTITGPSKLESTQRKFAALYHYRFFQAMEYHYDHLLERLNLLALHNRRRHFEALFLINVFSATKCCSSVPEIVGLRVPTRNIRNFTIFTSSSSHWPLVRYISTANAVRKVTDIFGNSCLSVKSLNWLIFLCSCCNFFVLCCHIVVVYIRTYSVTDYLLLSSASIWI